MYFVVTSNLYTTLVGWGPGCKRYNFYLKKDGEKRIW